MPRVINIHNNEKTAGTVFKIIGKLTTILLDPSDIVSYNTASKIYEQSAVLIRSSVFEDKQTAIRMIQAVMNLANIIFQYTGTWTTYLFGSVSGLKKIYYCIFRNPIYGALFFATFYTKLFDNNVDKEVFNKVVASFGISRVDELGATAFIQETSISVAKYVANVIATFGSDKLSSTTEGIISQTAISVMSIAPNLAIDFVVAKIIDKAEQYVAPEYEAIDLGDLDITQDNTEIMNHIDNVMSGKAKREALKTVSNTKRTYEKVKAIREHSEVVDEFGKKVCLGDCKPRIKAEGGCYCDGECGSYNIITGRSWCWVDPVKCKKAKTRATFMGKPFDYCTPKKFTKEPLCFTGYYYDVCGNTKQPQNTI